MARKSIDLLSTTPAEWANYVLDNFAAFLADHASCERKAASLAVSLAMKYPQYNAITLTLINIAQEEMDHFAQVYRHMHDRKIRLTKDTPDPYVNALIKLERTTHEQKFLDKLLVSSVVECRGAERFGVLSTAMKQTKHELSGFYDGLYKAELKHGHQFADLALKCFPEDIVYPRLQQLMQSESEIIASLPWRASLH